MRSFLALLGFALTVATLLYMGQEPDPPARVAELISGMPSKDGSRCDVANSRRCVTPPSSTRG